MRWASTIKVNELGSCLFGQSRSSRCIRLVSCCHCLARCDCCNGTQGGIGAGGNQPPGAIPVLDQGSAIGIVPHGPDIARGEHYHIERLPKLLRVDRVNPEIEAHPEALRVAEEEEWQDKGHGKADDDQQGYWLLCDGKPGGQWYDDDRYQ